MKSDLPKVLHEIDGRPMVSYVVDAVKTLGAETIVVVIGYKASMVREALAGENVEFVLQEEQLGTGHAVAQCKTALSGFRGTVMVLNGDVPCLRPDTLRRFLNDHVSDGASATVLTAVLDDPTGYGRIVRAKDGSLLRIVEHKDATEAELAIKEINSGMFCFDDRSLFAALSGMDRDNAQNEYYLTDVIELMKTDGERVRAYCVEDPGEVAGVNNLSELELVREYLKGKS